MKHITILIFLMMILGCSPTQQELNSYITANIDIDKTVENQDINSLFRYSHFVALETLDNIKISQVSKTQIINNKIYILDIKQSAIFVFNMDGSFIFKISKKGRARDEYLSISDFEVDKDGSIYVNDDSLGYINVYDESGNIQKRIKCPRRVWSFKILRNNIFACNLGNGFGVVDETPTNFNYFCFSDQGGVQHQDVPFNEELLGNKFINGNYGSSFYLYRDNIYMGSMLNNSIYQIDIDNGDIEPRIVYTMNSQALPKVDDSKKYVTTYLSNLRKGTQPSSIYNFYCFKNGMMVSFTYQYRLHTTVTSLSGDILYSGRIVADECNMIAAFTPYLDSDNTGYAIKEVSTDRILMRLEYLKKNNVENHQLNQIADQITNDSNPVLFFYNWVY